MAAFQKLKIRIDPADRVLIDRAAKVANTSRNRFMIDSARSAAVAAIVGPGQLAFVSMELEAAEKVTASKRA